MIEANTFKLAGSEESYSTSSCELSSICYSPLVGRFEARSRSGRDLTPSRLFDRPLRTIPSPCGGVQSTTLSSGANCFLLGQLAFPCPLQPRFREPTRQASACFHGGHQSRNAGREPRLSKPGTPARNPRRFYGAVSAARNRRTLNGLPFARSRLIV